MKLYIGNNLKQRLVLHYRMLEMPPEARAYSIAIPPGAQEIIPHDLTSADVDHLLDQWKHFNFVEAGSIAHMKGHIGITYRVEKPITAGVLQQGVDQNVDAAVKRSEKVFTESGVALADIIGKRAAEEGNNLRRVAVSVQEDFEGKAPKNAVARGVEVSRSGRAA